MKKVIVLFVEGDTEVEFYNLLMNYYKSFVKSFPDIKIINLKGIGRFEGKVSSKIKHEILNNSKYGKGKIDVKVFCCYDTDVFELGKKPPTNWKIVRGKLKELGINSFFEIKAEKMIEDWFIYDLEGICKSLNTKLTKTKGKNGLTIMKEVFKNCKKPKVYQKGSYTHNFLSDINIEKIRNSLSEIFTDLEKEVRFESKPVKKSSKSKSKQ